MRLYNLIKRVIQDILHWLNRIYQSLRGFPNRVTKNSKYNREQSLMRKQEESILNLQENVMNLRKEIASAITSQKFLEQQYLETQSQCDEWRQRAEEARQQGDEQLASEALSHQQRYADEAIKWKTKLDELTTLIPSLQRDWKVQENQVYMAKAKKFIYRLEQLKKNLDNGAHNSEEQLIKLRQTVNNVMNEQSRLQRQYELVLSSVEKWQEKLDKYRDKDEQSASEALSWHNSYANTIVEMQEISKEINTIVKYFKRVLIEQEFIFNESRNKQAIYDLEKLIEKFKNPQEDLTVLRQELAKAIATTKRIEQQYKQVQTEVDRWQKNAVQACYVGDEELARQCLVRKKNFVDAAIKLKAMLDDANILVDVLKQDLINITQNRSTEI
jgi:phage shock protein A